MYSKKEIKRAKKQVKKKKEFYQHLMSFVMVNIAILAINLLTTPDNFWFVFPFIGWGIAIMFHYTDVFGIPSFATLDKNWEERELELELRKNRGTVIPKLPAEDKKGLKLKELNKNYDESEFV